MTSVQAAPTNPIDLADSFAKVDLSSVIPIPSRYNNQPSKFITDAEDIKKAIFQTSYEPSEKLWADSQASHKAENQQSVPEGFPERATGKSVWDGKKLINEPEKWLHTLTQEEVDDVRQAIDHFLSLSLPFKAVDTTTFPLKVLNKELAKVTDEIHHGLGLRVLRGLPVQTYNRKEQLVSFLGIGSYLGRRKNQGANRGIVHLRDITNLAADKRPAIVVKGQTGGNQVFHTDNGDIVGLLTLDKAASGGLSQLSSIGQTYNAFVDKGRQDILRTLASSDWKSKFDANADGSALIHHVDGRVIAQYARRPFFPFFESIEPDHVPLPADKHLALDAVHFTAEEHSLDIDLQPGDLEFFSNLTLFHARTSSTDSEEHSRHLLRIWLSDPANALAHGPALDQRWAKLEFDAEPKFALEAWDEGA